MDTLPLMLEAMRPVGNKQETEAAKHSEDGVLEWWHTLRMTAKLFEGVGRPSMGAPATPKRSDFSADYFNFIAEVIAHIHATDRSLKRGILVFLPTYQAITSLGERVRRDIEANRWSEEMKLLSIHGLVDVRDVCPTVHSSFSIFLLISHSFSSSLGASYFFCWHLSILL